MSFQTRKAFVHLQNTDIFDEIRGISDPEDSNVMFPDPEM